MKPRGRFENLASTVGDLAGAVRRRRDERPERVRILDADGRGRVLPAEDEAAERLLVTARALIAAADPPLAAPAGDDEPPSDDASPGHGAPPGHRAPPTGPAGTP